MQSKLMKPFLLTAIFLLALAANLWGNEYYVAKSGNDKDPGTETQPWLSIQKAANTAVAGDTVYIKSGTYTEVVTIANSGANGKCITFKEYPGNTVILDGTSNAGWWGIVNIHGKDYIKLEGFEIRNNGIGWGLLIEHELGNVNNPATYIELSGLEVHHTGGEAIQVRGNAHNIVIKNCVVHDSNKHSGIDIYQWDGGRPHHVLVRGCTAYNFPRFAGIASEQADDLIIENNVSYNNKLGIDIGSGKNNIIKNNNIHNCRTGIAISSNEDSQIYSNIIHDIADEAFYNYYWSTHGESHARNKYYNNVVYNAGFGIFESNQRPGYSAGSSSGHQYYNNLFYNIGTHGTYRTSFYFKGIPNLKFYDNTIYMNANYSAIEIHNSSTAADLQNNIISMSGSYSAITIDTSSQPGSVIDYNCYHNRSGTSGGQGSHSVRGDPRFVNPGGGNFELQSESPCIDAGTSTGTPATDIRDRARCDNLNKPNAGGGSNPYYDMGAYEYPCDNIRAPAPPRI